MEAAPEDGAYSSPLEDYVKARRGRKERLYNHSVLWSADETRLIMEKLTEQPAHVSTVTEGLTTDNNGRHIKDVAHTEGWESIRTD